MIGGVGRGMRSALRGRGNGRRADRITAGLAAIAVATAGSVIAGEAVRLARRRVRQAPEPPTPAVTLGAAGQATQDTVTVLVEGLGAGSRGEVVLFNVLSGFVGAFALVRLSTAGIRSGWWPFGNVRLGGRHIHHFVPGILLAFGCGTGALITSDRRTEGFLAIPFGAGMGLTFDEAALLLDLRDVYWSREGLLSVQISLGTSALLGATILGLRILRRGEQRVERQGLIPTEAGEIATPTPVPA
jgi:hypothetical protein